MKIKVIPPKGFGVKIPRDITPVMRKIGQYQGSTVQRRIYRGIGPPNAPLTKNVKRGGKTLRDMGHLIASITSKGEGNIVSVGTVFKHAMILHHGGVITPKRAKDLWIPASSKTRSLMRKYGSDISTMIRRMKADGYNLWKSKSGKAFMAKKKKGSEPAFVLFVLKKSVKIPPRPFLLIDSVDRKIIMSMFRNFIMGGK